MVLPFITLFIFSLEHEMPFRFLYENSNKEGFSFIRTNSDNRSIVF